jgi:preprotein translocase subunit SecE
MAVARAAPGPRRGVAQLARAPVSKTGGWGFETLRPCQAGTARSDTRPSRAAGKAEVALAEKFNPAQFFREVRAEVAKVTWPTRKETLITTGLVLALSALAALFFLVVDQIIQLVMSWVFGF